eukprot:2357419-Prymnesium_polylepis.1
MYPTLGCGTSRAAKGNETRLQRSNHGYGTVRSHVSRAPKSKPGFPAQSCQSECQERRPAPASRPAREVSASIIQAWRRARHRGSSAGDGRRYQIRARRRFRRPRVARAAAILGNSLLRGYRRLKRRTRSIILNSGKPGLTWD